MINPHPISHCMKKHASGDKLYIEDSLQNLANSAEKYAATLPCLECGGIQAHADTGLPYDDIWCFDKNILHRTEVKAQRCQGKWKLKRGESADTLRKKCQTEKWVIKLGAISGFYETCLKSIVNLVIIFYDYSVYPGFDCEKKNSTVGIYDQVFIYGLALKHDVILECFKQGDLSPIRFIKKE